MRFFVEMNSNFTSAFFSDHGRLVVAKTNFKFITSGIYIYIYIVFYVFINLPVSFLHYIFLSPGIKELRIFRLLNTKILIM